MKTSKQWRQHPAVITQTIIQSSPIQLDSSKIAKLKIDLTISRVLKYGLAMIRIKKIIDWNEISTIFFTESCRIITIDEAER
jgi:hypothetical protein